MSRRRIASFGLLLLLASIVAPGPARADDALTPPSATQDRWADFAALGGTEEVGLLVPTRWGNVAPLVPPAQQTRMVRIGTGPDALAVLAMTFGGTPHASVTSPLGAFSTDQEVIEVVLGVALYVGTDPSDLTRFQFYTLRSYVNWAPLHDAWDLVGLPVELVEDMTHVVHRDPLTGLGTFAVDVPAGSGGFRLTGRMLLPLLVPFAPVEAANYYAGPHGLVRVHHDSREAVGLTPTATLVAEPGSIAAQVVGGASVSAAGVFLRNDPSHHAHRASIVAG